MSEINSIANGTFVIGQTSATNFEAGPGISITQPDVGTVRIANDETVLWENPNNSYNVNMSLSEPLSSFDYIQFDYSMSINTGASDWAYNTISCVIPTQNIMVNKRFCLNGMIPDSLNAGTMVIRNMIYTISDDAETLTFSKAYQLYFNGSTWNTGNSNLPVYKVVGINRKEV